MTPDTAFIERTLANGLRLVIEPMPHVASAAAGFLVRTGSRDETPNLAGVSHFVEHMCFKGTHHRTWREITRDFDELGSTYNAYTSKERTFYYGWVRADDHEKQLALLADMMRSAFPPQEFETEKKVILEEIAMSEDQIEDRVYDLIHDRAYNGHPLAWPVLGTAKTVEALSRDQLYGYFESRYHPANMILLVAGAVEPRQVVAAAERLCGDWAAKPPGPARLAPPPWRKGLAVPRTDRFQQQALVVAFPAPCSSAADRETADVLAAILGGHNSRFFWNIIQTGIAPHVAAMRLDYCDVGMMIAFGCCEPQHAERMIDAIRAEIATVVREGVRDEEVQRVKNRVRTALATEAESPYYRLMQLASDLDDLGRPRMVSERLEAIDRVTVQSIREYLAAWPMADNAYLAGLGPCNWPTR